jgi:hypothetical protein
MSGLITFIKWLLLLEIALVVFFIIISYMGKLYYTLKYKRRDKTLVRLRKLIATAIKQDQELSLKEINSSKKLITDLLILIREFDTTQAGVISWQKIREQLFSSILRNKVKKYSYAGNWFKRYLAAQIYYLDIKLEDEEVIIKLLQDPILLVSINAAHVAFKYHNKKLLNAVIDTFYTKNRMEQSFYSHLVAENIDPNVMQIIKQRIEHEKNEQVKIFCYRLLTELPSYGDIAHSALKDVQSGNFEMKIATLHYLAHDNRDKALPVLRQCLNDDHWEVRGAAINMLGELKDTESLPMLKEKLKDPQWWVRIRSAEALAKFGDVGLKVLKDQDPKIDRYAYEAATQVLLTNQLSR